jgi:hypothetical protein
VYGVWRGDAIHIPGQWRGEWRREESLEQKREKQRREVGGPGRLAAGADRGGPRLARPAAVADRGGAGRGRLASEQIGEARDELDWWRQ